MQRLATWTYIFLISVGVIATSSAGFAQEGLIRCAEYQAIGKFSAKEESASLETTGPSGSPIKIHFKKASNQILLIGLNGFVVQSHVIILKKESATSYLAKLKSVSPLPDGAGNREALHLITKSACGSGG